MPTPLHLHLDLYRYCSVYTDNYSSYSFAIFLHSDINFIFIRYQVHLTLLTKGQNL